VRPTTRRDFLLGRTAAPRTPIAHIGEGCLEPAGIVCQACRDACTPRAIRFPPSGAGFAAPVIDASRCTGCGECVGVCPGHAITLEGAA
jgi:ferredoxin-type protein NapF